MSDALVVVGAGIAGVSAAAGARAAGFEGDIVLLGDEPQLPYRRPPVSKEVVRGEKGADDVRIRKPEWYDAQRVTLRTGTRVLDLDTAGRTVGLDDGSRLDYGSLVLATGGRARTVATDSPTTSHRVRTLRDLADADALRADLVPDAHVVVVGAGLIGSEIAANARAAGAGVTLLEADALPMSRVLTPELGHWCAELHRDHGTDLHTSVLVERIDDDADGTVTVRSADGRSWTGSVVVLAVGMEPNVELAREAGLDVAAVEHGGGVVVDELGRTSVPGVWAAGDVARMPNDVLGGLHRVEHWQNAQNHGTSVGRAVAGAGQGFHEVPWAWSDQYGHTIQVTGWPSGEHDLVVRGSLPDRDFTAFLLDDGVLRGAVTVGRPREVRLARTWIAQRVRPDLAVLADGSRELADAVDPVGPT